MTQDEAFRVKCGRSTAQPTRRSRSSVGHPPVRTTGPATGETERRRLIQLLLHDPHIPTVDRVTGWLVLLYAQHLSRIAALTRGQSTTAATA
jgi:hypothetical protein